MLPLMSGSHPTSHGLGFTLVEVMLTAALIAVLALIALPRFDASSDRRHAETAAHRLLADLEWARTAARALGAPVTVTLNDSNTADNGWTLRGVAPQDIPHRARNPSLRAAVTALNLLDSEGKATTEITFDPLGIPSASGKVLLTSGKVTSTLRIEAPSAALWIEN